VQKKIFWLIFAGLGLVADFTLPFWWQWLRRFPSSRFPGGLRIVRIGSEMSDSTSICRLSADPDMP